MISLRKKLMSILSEYHDEVYYQQATDKTPFPYVTYNFPNSFINEDQEVFALDVDIWDNKNDTLPLETIASNIWRGLHKLNYLDDDIQFSIYRDNRLPPLDEDATSIKRRKLIFELRYFDRQL